MNDSLIPLLLYMEGCATKEEMNANVTASLERGYVRINEYLGMYSGEVSICGAGPTLRETFRHLKGDVLAVNSAIGFLIDEGIVPKFGMIWDASALCAKFAIPHPDVTYLIAARCHPSVFERLKDCRVIVWHAGGDHNIADYLAEKQIMEPMINGGSAGVTRAMYLAIALGYRKLNLFGADSSYSGDETHVNGSLVSEKDFMISVGNHPERLKYFRTTPEWCAQVNEFRDIYHFLRHPAMDMQVDVYGDGMLPHMAALLKAKEAEGTLETLFQPLDKEAVNAGV